MKRFFTWLVWSLMRVFGLSDYADSILVGILAIIVVLGVLLGIVYIILTTIVNKRKAKIKKNEEEYRNRFAEFCKELVDGEPEINFNEEESVFCLKVDDDITVTYDPQEDIISVKKIEDPNLMLPDLAPGYLRINLRSAAKETDAFANCKLIAPSDKVHEEGLLVEVVIPKEKLQEGQLADIKKAFEKFEVDYSYVSVLSDKIYHKVYDLKETSAVAKTIVKTIYPDAVVYHAQYTQESAQMRVLVYVKRKDATVELLDEIKKVINDLPIGDNKKTILADGSIMRQ